MLHVGDNVGRFYVVYEKRIDQNGCVGIVMVGTSFTPNDEKLTKPNNSNKGNEKETKRDKRR